jgi:hypothetical protein
MQLIPDTLWQNRVHDLWSKSPRPVKWLLSEVANVLCSRLDSITSHPTALTCLRFGDIIALCDKVDLGALLNERDLPDDLQALVSEYSRDDWHEMLSLASSPRADIERALRANPHLGHLRRRPETQTEWVGWAGLR